MKKAEMNILECVFDAEVKGALSGGVHLFQTRSKAAEKLVSDGLISKAKTTLGGRFPVTIEGYELTELGRLTYCTSCAAPPEGKVRA